MKILIAQFQQETNTFSPVVCSKDFFKNSCLKYGNEILDYYRGTRTEMAAFIDLLEQERAEIIPSIAAHSVSAGPVDKYFFLEVSNSILSKIKEYGSIDGVLLCLHGATVCTHEYDGAGTLLELVRKAVGIKTVIGASLDIHANVTKRMIDSSDILVGYKTYPHIDLYETGRKTANLLVRAVRKEIYPVISMNKLPMILLGEASQTTSGPMKAVIDNACNVEKKKNVLSVSVFQMQPWIDEKDTGCSVIVNVDKNAELAKEEVLKIGSYFWNKREKFVFDLSPIEAVINAAMKKKKRPVIAADSADGTGSGSPGDSNFILKAIVDKSPDLFTYLTVTDSETVERAIEVGVGNSEKFYIGGKIDKVNFKPVALKCYVKSISDGKFYYKGPQFTGERAFMGKTAVLQHKGIFIVAMEKSAFNWDPELYRSQGLEPLDANLIVVKSPNAFRAAYKTISDEMYVIDAPGISSPNLKLLPFRNLPKPMYPFNEVNTVDTTKNIFTNKNYKEDMRNE